MCEVQLTLDGDDVSSLITSLNTELFIVVPSARKEIFIK
jgi:hypothetical protein